MRRGTIAHGPFVERPKHQSWNLSRVLQQGFKMCTTLYHFPQFLEEKQSKITIYIYNIEAECWKVSPGAETFRKTYLESIERGHGYQDV